MLIEVLILDFRKEPFQESNTTMKKIFTITLIMLIAFSIVLVSCSNNPNEEKKEETPKEEKISDSQLKVLGEKYSALSTNVTSLITTVDKDSEDYKEERTLTVTSSSKDSFSLVTAEEVAKVDEKDGGTSSEDTGVESSSTETETLEPAAYKSLSWSVSYKNIVDEDVLYFTRSGLTLKITLSTDDSTTYSDDEGSSYSKIEDSSLMNEYQALLDLFKSSSDDSSYVLSFEKNSDAMKKVITLVHEYAPEFKVNITFGTKSQGKLEADVILNVADDGRILVNVKSATVSISEKKIFTTENAAFKVTPGDDFNLKFKLNGGTDGSGYYITLKDMTVSGGVTVDFEDVTVKTPYDDKNNFEFVMKGSISYNFTSKDAKADVEVSDKATIDISGISKYLPEGVTLPSLGVTVGFTYDGKLTLPKADELKFEYFDEFVKNFKITKFMIGNLPITTDSVNKLIQDNSQKIYDYIGKVLTDAAEKASEAEKESLSDE